MRQPASLHVSRRDPSSEPSPSSGGSGRLPEFLRLPRGSECAGRPAPPPRAAAVRKNQRTRKQKWLATEEEDGGDRVDSPGGFFFFLIVVLTAQFLYVAALITAVAAVCRPRKQTAVWT